MPNADFFRRLGLFVIKDFFDTELCERFRLEACLATNTPARVVEKRTERVDESIRKTEWANVSAPMVSLVEARLLAVKPKLESHFEVRPRR